MKKHSISFIIAALTLASHPAFAADWALDTTISIVTAYKDHAFFAIKTTHSFAGCGDIAGQYLIAPGPQARDLLTIINAAHLAKRKVNIQLDGCYNIPWGGQTPIITAVQLK